MMALLIVRFPTAWTTNSVVAPLPPVIWPPEMMLFVPSRARIAPPRALLPIVTIVFELGSVRLAPVFSVRELIVCARSPAWPAVPPGPVLAPEARAMFVPVVPKVIGTFETASVPAAFKVMVVPEIAVIKSLAGMFAPETASPTKSEAEISLFVVSAVVSVVAASVLVALAALALI